MSKSSYQVEQFNTEHAPEEMVQYVLDNVDDFGHRYTEALKRIGTARGTLRWADPELYRYKSIYRKVGRDEFIKWVNEGLELNQMKERIKKQPKSAVGKM